MLFLCTTKISSLRISKSILYLHNEYYVTKQFHVKLSVGHALHLEMQLTLSQKSASS